MRNRWPYLSPWSYLSPPNCEKLVFWDKIYQVIGNPNAEVIKDITDSIQKGEFEKKYWLNDNHSHTDATDGIPSPRRLVDLAILNGITSLTVTDHNTVRPALEARKYANHINKKAGREIIRVNIGIELSTYSGHVIIANLPPEIFFNDQNNIRDDIISLSFPQPAKYSIKDYQEKYEQYTTNSTTMPLYPGMPIWDLLQQVALLKQQYKNIKLILPHPFDGNATVWKVLEKRWATNFFGLMYNLSTEEIEAIISQFDFIEWHDENSYELERFFGRFQDDANKQSYEYMINSLIKSPIFISGTDTHVGKFRSLMIVQKNENNDVFESLGKGNFVIVREEKLQVHTDDAIIKRIVNRMRWYITKTHNTNIFSDEALFYFSWALASAGIGDFFINEHKKAGVNDVSFGPSHERMDLIAKKVRRILYSMILKNRLYDILADRYKDDKKWYDKAKKKLKAIRNPGRRFYDGGYKN